MNAGSSTYDMIDGSLQLHGKIADSMTTLRNHVDSGEYIAMRKLLDSQLKLAERAGLMIDDIVSGTAPLDSAERVVIDELVRQIEHVLSVTDEISRHVMTEKDSAAQKLRTLQKGSRAVQSYARLSGR